MVAPSGIFFLQGKILGIHSGVRRKGKTHQAGHTFRYVRRMHATEVLEDPASTQQSENGTFLAATLLDTTHAAATDSDPKTHAPVQKPNRQTTRVGGYLNKQTRFAVLNEGKIPSVDLELIAEYMDAEQCGFALISEGTQTSSGVDYVRGGRFVYISDTNERKGGAAMMIDSKRMALRPGNKGTLWSNRARTSSCLYLAEGRRMRFMSIYCSPDTRNGDEALLDLLARLESDTAGVARCIMGGDWNAQTGTPRRAVLNAWMKKRGFTLASPQSLCTYKEFSAFIIPTKS